MHVAGPVHVRWTRSWISGHREAPDAEAGLVLAVTDVDDDYARCRELEQRASHDRHEIDGRGSLDEHTLLEREATR
jgi:hypothetical protein